MAIMDAFSPETVLTVNAAGTVDIRPGAGTEAKLHHVHHSGKGKLEWYDGTTTGPIIGNVSTAGTGHVHANGSLHLTNGLWVRFTSTEAANSQTLVYNGTYSK